MVFSDQVLCSVCSIVGCSDPQSLSDQFPGIRNKAYSSCPTRYTGEFSSECFVSASMYLVAAIYPQFFTVVILVKNILFSPITIFYKKSFFGAGQTGKGTCSYVGLGCVRSTHVGPTFQVFGFLPIGANAWK